MTPEIHWTELRDATNALQRNNILSLAGTVLGLSGTAARCLVSVPTDCDRLPKCRTNHTIKLAAIKYLENESQNIDKQQLTDQNYEGWNFNSGNYLFTTDTK